MVSARLQILLHHPMGHASLHFLSMLLRRVRLSPKVLSHLTPMGNHRLVRVLLLGKHVCFQFSPVRHLAQFRCQSPVIDDGSRRFLLRWTASTRT